MSRKPFAGLYQDGNEIDCPDLSGALPVLEPLPALVAALDADVITAPTFRKRRAPWTPYTEDGCLPIKIEPGRVRNCDGNEHRVLPGDTPGDGCGGLIIDVFNNSHHWVRTDIRTGLSTWVQGNAFPPQRIGHAFVNTPVLKLGKTSRFYEYTPEAIDGTTIVSADVKIKLAVTEDGLHTGCYEEKDLDDLIRPYRIVTLGVNDTLREKYERIAAELNRFEDVAAVVTVCDPDLKILVITTGNEFPANTGSFAASDPEHAALLMSSIVQLKDDVIDGFMPGDCEEGGKSLGCCTLEVSPVSLVGCEGSHLYNVYPEDYEPEGCEHPQLEICNPDNSHHWLELRDWGLAEWEHGKQFPYATRALRIQPVLRVGRTDRFRSLKYDFATDAGGMQTIEGVSAVEKVENDTSIECQDEAPVRPFATPTERYQVIVTRVMRRDSDITALVFPDEDDPDNKGVIIATSYGRVLEDFGSTETFLSSDERHCEVLSASVQRLIDGPVEAYSSAVCGKRAPWRPYDLYPSGAVCKTKINGGTFRWSDGTVTQVAPLSTTTIGISALSTPGEITVGGAANLVYLEINTATRAITWIQTDECLPQRVGDVLNVRVLRMGLTSTIKSLNAPADNYSDGAEFEVGDTTYVFGDSATGDDIPVPLGSTAEESLATLASRINNTHPTVSAIVCITGTGETEKTSLIATSVDPDEDMGGITGGGTASSEDRARLLSVSFKYDLDGEFSPGAHGGKRLIQFHATVDSTGATERLAIGPGTVTWPANVPLDVESDSTTGRFDELEVFDKDHAAFWIKTQVYPQIAIGSGTLKNAVVCESGAAMPGPTELRAAEDKKIYNITPIAGTIRTASLGRVAYSALPAAGATVTVNGVIYTWRDGNADSATEINIVADDLCATYDTLAWRIAQDADLVAMNVCDCSGTEGLVLVASYSALTTVPNTTAVAYSDTDEDHRALFLSGLRQYTDYRPIPAMLPEDHHLHAFKYIPTGANTAFRMAGYVRFWHGEGTTVFDVPEAWGVSAVHALAINVDAKTAELVPLSTEMLDGSADTVDLKYVPLATLVTNDVSFVYGNIQQLQTSDVLVMSAVLEVPDPDTKDYFLMWNGASKKIEWKTHPGDKDAVPYIKANHRIGWLEAGSGNKHHAIVVDAAGNFVVNWQRIDRTL